MSCKQPADLPMQGDACANRLHAAWLITYPYVVMQTQSDFHKAGGPCTASKFRKQPKGCDPPQPPSPSTSG